MSYPESPGGSFSWTDNKIVLGVLGLVLIVTLTSVQGQVSVSVTSDDIFTKLISVTSDLGQGQAVFEFTCPFDSGCHIGKELSARFIESEGSSVREYEYRYLAQIQEPVFEKTPFQKTCYEFNNLTQKNDPYSCTDHEWIQTGTVLKSVWKQIIPTLILNKGKHSIQVRAYWDIYLGPNKIDWVPKLSLDKADYPDLQNSIILEKQEWAWWNATFTRCRDIDIAHAGTVTLDNYPAFVNLTRDSDMEITGSDLRFVNEPCNDGGSQIPFDIDGYDGSSIQTWVRINLTSAGHNISVYYHNTTTVSRGENETGVYNYNVEAAHHMNDTTTSTISDSGPYGLDGTKAAANDPTESTGMIWKDQDFDGTDDYINLGTGANPGSHDFSFEFWIKSADTSGAATSPLSNREVSSPYTGILMYIQTDGYSYFQINDNGNFHTYDSGTKTLDDNQWHHFGCSIDRGANQLNCYVDGAVDFGDNIAAVTGTILSSNDLYLGADAIAQGNEINGEMDEFRFYNTTKHENWFNQSYSMVVDQSTYVTVGSEQVYGADIIISLNRPANTTYATSDIDLNVTTDVASDTCLYSLDSAANVTMNSFNVTYWYYEMTGVSDALHDVVVYCNTSGGHKDTAQQWFTVDTTPPTITIHDPQNITYTGATTDLKVSASESIDAWWYSLNGAANTTFSPNTTIAAVGGLNYIWVYANDSVNNIGSQGPVWFTYLNYSAGSTVYNSDAIEWTSQNFQMFLNFSDIDQISGVAGTLDYNGTTVTSTATLDGTGFQFNATISNIGDVNLSCCEKQSNEFFWNYSFTYDAGTESNLTQNESQISHKIILTNCTNTSLTNTKTIWFETYDEENGSRVVSNIEIAFDPVWSTPGYDRNWSWADLTKNVFPVCIYPSWAEYIVDSMSQFEKEGAAFKNYYLDNATLSNVTQNISIYLGSNETAELIQMEVLDHLGMPKPYVVITAQRYFIGENVYRTTGVFKTDFQGEASGYLVMNTVWYRFLISEESDILATYDPMTINSDEITFRLSSTGLGEWFQYYNGVGHNCTISDTTNTTTCTVADGTGMMVNVSLIVREYTDLGWLEICEDYSEASASTLVCSLGATQNRIYYYVLSAEFDDTVYELEAEWLDYRSGASLWGATGILLALMLTLVLVFMGGSQSPKIGVVMSGVGIGLSYGFGLLDVSYGSVVAIFIVIGVTLYVIRG